MMDTPLYNKFAERFGKDEADAIVMAARQHASTDNPGSDEFRWAITIVIGWDCVSCFAEHHGITISNDDFISWVKENADIKNHDGDFDILGGVCGCYNQFLDGE